MGEAVDLSHALVSVATLKPSCDKALGSLGAREIDVIREEQIELSVAVVIEERGRGAPARIIDAGLARHIAKSAAAEVLQLLIGTQIRDIEIHPTVVVEVTGGHSHPIAGGQNPG